MTTPRVAVFGAGGAVGRAVLLALHADPRLTAVASLRRAPALAPPTELRLADTADPASLDRALEGCSLAVNAVGGAPATLADATAALCAAARRAGVRRLVHLSSMAVYGSLATGLVDEAAALTPDGTAYEAAKIASEAAVRAHAAGGQEVVVLRPGLVFGPGSRQWAHRIARLLRARRLGDLGPAGDGFCNLTHESSLGAATAAALLSPEAAGRVFNLATPTPPSWNAFFVSFARALGATPVRRVTRRRLTLETRLLAPALAIAQRAARAGWQDGLPDPIPPSLLHLFGQRMRLDVSLAERLLALPPVDDAAAVAAVAAGLGR